MNTHEQVKLGVEIRTQLYNTLWKRIDIPLLTRLNNQLNNQLSNQLWDQLRNQIFTQLHNQLK